MYVCIVCMCVRIVRMYMHKHIIIHDTYIHTYIRPVVHIIHMHVSDVQNNMSLDEDNYVHIRIQLRGL